MLRFCLHRRPQSLHREAAAYVSEEKALTMLQREALTGAMDGIIAGRISGKEAGVRGIYPSGDLLRKESLSKALQKDTKSAERLPEDNYYDF